MAQWVKPLLIGHSACWRDGLMALTNLGSNAGLQGVFQLDWTSGHATRLNSRTGKEGSPVYKLVNCDRPLHSGIRAPETVMSTDGQIIELGHMHCTGHCSISACYDPGSVDRLCRILTVYVKM